MCTTSILAAAASGSLGVLSPVAQAPAVPSAPLPTGPVASGPAVSGGSDSDGEIVVVGKRPVIRRGAWVFERSDITMLDPRLGIVRLVPTAAWAICMPTADTDAAVRWLAQTGPYLTQREQDGALQRLEAINSEANVSPNDMLGFLPSNLLCYPPRRTTLRGNTVDSVQYCRQRHVPIGLPRRSFRMRLIGKHSNTRLSLRYEIDDTDLSYAAGRGWDPSEPSDGSRIRPVFFGDLGRGNRSVGGHLRMSITATWREECPADGRIPSLIAKK